MKLEEKLVQLRKEKCLSQMCVAEAMEVSRQAISRWEVGTALPSTENLRKLAELYEVSMDSLLNESVELNESVDIKATEKACQTTEDVPLPKENTLASTTSKPNIKTVIYAVISAILALLIFLAGYMLGRANTKQTQNDPIPLSELETMDLDLSNAATGTFGWPDFGEGGE